MLRKDELLQFLQESGSNERGLADAEAEYVLIPYPYDNDVASGAEYPLGYVFVMVEEGILQIPYSGYDADMGYEQFTLEAAEIIPSETAQKLIDEATVKVKFMKSFLTKAKGTYGQPKSSDMKGGYVSVPSAVGFQSTSDVK